MRRIIGKMTNVECRMTDCRASVSVPNVFGIHRNALQYLGFVIPSRFGIHASSFFRSPLAERTLFGFVICHGYATYLVRSVGLQNCDPERKSSARRSVALESCFRKGEGRNRRAQACRSHPDYARSL